MSDEEIKHEVYEMKQTNVDVSDSFKDCKADKPEDIVRLTQNVRMGILKNITGHGKALPKGDDEIKLTLQLMKDMDVTAQNTVKLKIEEGNAQNVSEIAGMASMFKAKLAELASGASRMGSVTDGLILPDIDIVEGELEQGERTVNPDEYLS